MIKMQLKDKKNKQKPLLVSQKTIRCPNVKVAVTALDTKKKKETVSQLETRSLSDEEKVDAGVTEAKKTLIFGENCSKFWF